MDKRPAAHLALERDDGESCFSQRHAIAADDSMCVRRVCLIPAASLTAMLAQGAEIPEEPIDHDSRLGVA